MRKGEFHSHKMNVYHNNVQVKTFYGSAENALIERFEMWMIKQPYDREEITTHIGFCQHANNSIDATKAGD